MNLTNFVFSDPLRRRGSRGKIALKMIFSRKIFNIASKIIGEIITVRIGGEYLLYKVHRIWFNLSHFERLKRQKNALEKLYIESKVFDFENNSWRN